MSVYRKNTVSNTASEFLADSAVDTDGTDLVNEEDFIRSLERLVRAMEGTAEAPDFDDDEGN
jgi:hypothetical protein